MAEASKQEEANIWTVNQRQFMVYLATPSELRVPLTETAFAKEIGVNPATLWKWKQKPDFRAEVHKLITDSLGDSYHDVMHAFKQEATKGSFPHQKMYFEMMGLYVEKREVSGANGGNLIIEVVYADAKADADAS